MFKPVVGVALVLTLTAAGAQTPAAAPESAADGETQVVKITGTKPTPTGEPQKVFAAKQSVLRGTLAFKCAMDSVYFTQEDDTEQIVQQMEAAQVPGEISDSSVPLAISASRRFSGSAPTGDVSNMQETSSIPGIGTTSNMGPCNDKDRKEASARESIIRRDKSFGEALEAYDAKDYAKAATLLQDAYKKIGYPEAAVLLARMSLSGQGMPRSTDKAMDWIDRAVMVRFDAGRSRFQFNPKDPEAMNGMIEGTLLRARMALDGSNGIKKDPSDARKWYAKAADFGYVPALNTLGQLSQSGIGGAKDIKKAQDYFSEAADQGYAPAQYNLANLYYLGQDGVKQDYALARNWYAKAGQAGHAKALYTLARMYDLGEGVAADQKKAIVYYKAAALKSEPDALSALALYFYEGDQVPKDLATARKLLNEAAIRGQSDAMFNLAVMLTKGEGGDKDLGMAYVWFSLAKTSGHKNAAQGLADVSKKMSDQDRATADAILKPRSGTAAKGG